MCFFMFCFELCLAAKQLKLKLKLKLVRYFSLVQSGGPTHSQFPPWSNTSGIAKQHKHSPEHLKHSNNGMDFSLAQCRQVEVKQALASSVLQVICEPGNNAHSDCWQGVHVWSQKTCDSIEPGLALS